MSSPRSRPLSTIISTASEPEVKWPKRVEDLCELIRYTGRAVLPHLHQVCLVVIASVERHLRHHIAGESVARPRSVSGVGAGPTIMRPRLPPCC